MIESRSRPHPLTPPTDSTIVLLTIILQNNSGKQVRVVINHESYSFDTCPVTTPHCIRMKFVLQYFIYSIKQAMQNTTIYLFTYDNNTQLVTRHMSMKTY